MGHGRFTYYLLQALGGNAPSALRSAIFYGTEPSILNWCDMLFLPLGLAYGKIGSSMPYFETIIRDGLDRGDQRFVAHCIEGLGTAGFYYPKAVFQTLRTAIADLMSPELELALTRCISKIRVLYFDDVDHFLNEIGAQDTIRHRLAVATDVTLMSRYIYWIGFYNHCVHSSLFHPKLLQGFSMSALNFLAEAHTPQRNSLIGILCKP